MEEISRSRPKSSRLITPNLYTGSKITIPSKRRCGRRINNKGFSGRGGYRLKSGKYFANIIISIERNQGKYGKIFQSVLAFLQLPHYYLFKKKKCELLPKEFEFKLQYARKREEIDKNFPQQYQSDIQKSERYDHRSIMHRAQVYTKHGNIRAYACKMMHLVIQSRFQLSVIQNIRLTKLLEFQKHIISWF